MANALVVFSIAASGALTPRGAMTFGCGAPRARRPGTILKNLVNASAGCAPGSHIA